MCIRGWMVPTMVIPTEKDLDYFKAKGLYLVRFPFRWERIQPTMNGELNCNRAGKNEEIRQSR